MGIDMSRFIDKLKQTTRAVSQPMGFKAAISVSAKPKILLVASVAGADIRNLADSTAGADAVSWPLSKSSQGVKVLKEVNRVVSGLPWGGRIEDGGVSGLEPVVKAGCDFIVFPATSTFLSIVETVKVGEIIAVEASLSDGLLKAIDDLPVDAVLINSELEESLTWQHLMLFQRFANILSKPLLTQLPFNLSAHELQALWSIGLDAVVVDVGVGQPVERISQLREVIDGVDFPLRRRGGKGEALLPYIGAAKESVTEQEQEEEAE